MPDDDETIVIAEDSSTAESYKIKNKSRMMVVANLDTYNKKGKRESLYLAPNEIKELTDAQYKSDEVQKLLKVGYLVRR